MIHSSDYAQRKVDLTKTQFPIHHLFHPYAASLESSPPDFAALVESILNWVCHTQGEDLTKSEIASLGDELGKFYPEDRLYEDRTNYLIALYLFSPSHDGIHLRSSPYENFCRAALTDRFSTFDDQQMFVAPHHSLFMVKKSHQHQLILTDLFTDKEHLVCLQAQASPAFQKGSLFQSLLFRWQSKWHLSNGFVFHPPESLKCIRKFLQSHPLQGKEGNTRLIILKKLAAIHMAHYRLQHVSPLKIYQQRLV
jgi:hypothetical protein